MPQPRERELDDLERRITVLEQWHTWVVRTLATTVLTGIAGGLALLG